MKLPIKTVAIELIDHEVAGEYVRVKRQASGMSLRGLAKKMRVSAPYLSDLERANRKWTQALFDKALKCILWI